MNTTSTFENGLLTISIIGKISASEAQKMQEEIKSAIGEHDQIESIVIDAAEMSFISSMGLRVFLMLAKEYSDLRIINCSADVFNVFKMTGFHHIIKVEKVLQQISIEGLEQLEGMQDIYQLTEDTVVKVFPAGTAKEDVEKEVTLARELFIHGIPSAMAFDMVRVDGRYGLIYEKAMIEEMNAKVEAESPFPSNIDFNKEIRELERKRFYLDSDVDIDWLANALGTNRHYVSDYFNKVLHTSFNDYINTMRLDYAVLLIRAGKTPSSQVAYSSGFNNDHTFRRLFKQRFGCTPTQFKK